MPNFGTSKLEGLIGNALNNALKKANSTPYQLLAMPGLYELGRSFSEETKDAPKGLEYIGVGILGLTLILLLFTRRPHTSKEDAIKYEKPEELADGGSVKGTITTVTKAKGALGYTGVDQKTLERTLTELGSEEAVTLYTIRDKDGKETIIGAMGTPEEYRSLKKGREIEVNYTRACVIVVGKEKEAYPILNGLVSRQPLTTMQEQTRNTPAKPYNG